MTLKTAFIFTNTQKTQSIWNLRFFSVHGVLTPALSPLGGGDSDAVLHNTAGHRDLFFLGMDGLVGLFVEKWWVMTLALAASPGEG